MKWIYGLMMMLLMTVMATALNVSITTPVDGANYTTEPNLSFSVTGEASRCWYNYNNTLVNITNCTSPVSGIIWKEATNTVWLYASNGSEEEYNYVSANHSHTFYVNTTIAEVVQDNSAIMGMAMLGFFIGAVWFTAKKFLK
jgi:hypothetical protein